ncbi:ABC transporter G family member STR2-like [Andrographis paniculata]|uniref:ABC transporter G family member STR2-like n=1 Tax=Andrographis paniculata TaxID=175694 RepID=UPI0021E78603|nr:ABC transporter G family member STR2-like [Andrographis paniculata]
MKTNNSGEGRRPDMVIDIGRPVDLAGGLEFSGLTYTVIKNMKDADGRWTKQEADLLHEITGYAPKGCVTAVMGPSGAGKSTFLDALAGRISWESLAGMVSLDGVEVSPSLIKRTSAYIMQDDRLFPMLTVYETLMFAADFRLRGVSRADKRQRVENLIEQLGLMSARNTYIGDEGTRGVSGGERRRVSIGVDIIHGPPLLFLDEPTSGLDSTSAHSVIEKVHNIARGGSTVVLTIHQPSARIQLLLDHLIILARGQLMYQGPPKDMTPHLERMDRKVPKGESSIEYFIDVVQEYDQSEFGVEALAKYTLTGVKPPPLFTHDEMPSPAGHSFPTRPNGHHHHRHRPPAAAGATPKRLPLQTLKHGFDHSVRSQYSWSVSQSMTFTPVRKYGDQRTLAQKSPSRGYYAYSSDVLQGTPTPRSSDYTVNEDDYITHSSLYPSDLPPDRRHHLVGPKFANSFFYETWILMRRNFIIIMRTPELFLSRLVVLTFMGIMMATLFWHPKGDSQGITNRISFFIFTVCLFFFSSNDAVPAFIQERFIFIRETSHNAYRSSSYTVAGLVTYLPFLALQAALYAVIVWFPLKLEGPFVYFLLVLYMSLLSTNSFVVFISSIVPNYILGYAAVIAFTALFFLFCGYFLDSNAIPGYWKWMYYVSTMTYPYEGLLMNEYETSNPFGGIQGYNILKSLAIGTKANEKWEKIYAMLGWAVLYRVLFYIVLRFFSKNQRS